MTLPAITITDPGASATKVVRAWTIAESDFTVTSTTVDTFISGASAGPVTVDDAVFDSSTGATVDRGGHVAVGETPSPIIGFESLSPGIGTVDSNGNVTRVSDGTAGILVKTHRAVKRANITCLRSGGQTTNTFSHWANGSLAKDATDTIDVLASAGGDKCLINGDGTRNPSCWASAFNLSGCLQYQSLSGYRYGATVVSRNCAVGAGHVNLHAGFVLTWQALDGTLVSRTIIETRSVGYGGIPDAPNITDPAVYLLDSPLPASIASYSVMPVNWTPKLPGLTRTVGITGTPTIPILFVDKERNAILLDWYGTDSPTLDQPYLAIPVVPARAVYYEGFVLGDSGSPLFIVIGSQPVLFYVASGWSTANQVAIDAINTAMTAMAGETLTTVNLSGYPTY